MFSVTPPPWALSASLAACVSASSEGAAGAGASERADFGSRLSRTCWRWVNSQAPPARTAIQRISRERRTLRILTRASGLRCREPLDHPVRRNEARLLRDDLAAGKD